jgi:hypothetical protein
MPDIRKIGMGRDCLQSGLEIVSVLPIGAEAANTSGILHASLCEIIPPFEKPLV